MARASANHRPNIGHDHRNAKTDTKQAMT